MKLRIPYDIEECRIIRECLLAGATHKEISFEDYDAWTAICKERSMKSNYKPEHKFKGWTECYE